MFPLLNISLACIKSEMNWHATRIDITDNPLSTAVDIIEAITGIWTGNSSHFFGDSTVLLPNSAALFIVLMLCKTSRLLAWQWSLLFGIAGVIVCAPKLAFMGWGICELDYWLQRPSGPSLLWLLRSCFSVGLHKAPLLPSMFWPLWWAIRGWFIRRAFRLGSGLPAAAGKRFVPAAAKRTSDPGKREYLMGRCRCPVMVPLILLHSGSKAPTQSPAGTNRHRGGAAG